MTSSIIAIEFIKNRKRLLPAVLISYLVITVILALYLPRLTHPGQFIVLVKLFVGIFAPLLMSVSIIQTVQHDRTAGNFMITTHLRNPYFIWGEMQVVTHWIFHTLLAIISYIILSHMAHVTINWLPSLILLNLLMVAQITYLLSRNLNSVLSYLIVAGATIIALIAETALFDYTMFFVPTTWLIRFSYMASIGFDQHALLVVSLKLFIFINILLVLVNYLISKIKPLP
ncbi:hypothetical protein [Weissella cibaria]|uniref:hypothetical protein n=1 Tax=Weissella cibaria TaxID=137591 RepID=UPI00223C3576|nr:hypothetical protein [Weissella cibaria]MCT0000455.1 hypothetical protein [Weissella cibaria]